MGSATRVILETVAPKKEVWVQDFRKVAPAVDGIVLS